MPNSRPLLLLWFLGSEAQNKNRPYLKIHHITIFPQLYQVSEGTVSLSVAVVEERNMLSLRSCLAPSFATRVLMVIASFSLTTIQARTNQGLIVSSARVGTRAALARYPWLRRTHSSLCRTTQESPHLRSLAHRSPQSTFASSESFTWAVPPGGGFQKKQHSKDDTNVLVQLVQDSFNPGSLSYGFVTGYVSGVALKTVGQATATILGECAQSMSWVEEV